MPLANSAGSNARACRMLSWKASVVLRPAVAGRESNSGKSSIPASSRTRFFTELVEDSGSYGVCGITLHDFTEFAAEGVDFGRLDQVFHILEIYASFKTLRAAERVQFHRDEMERTWYEEVETLPDVAAATFASDFGEGLCVGQHQIHRERCGRIVRETQAGKISRPVKHGVAVLLKKGEPTLRLALAHQKVDVESSS
jgi:hypothetical protein